MTLVVKSDNEINNTKTKIAHKKHTSKKYATSTSTKNLVNIQPKPSPPFILPCQPPFIYPNSNSPSVVAQQQLFSLQLLMSSPYIVQALANLNNTNNNNNASNSNINASANTTATDNKSEKTTSNNTSSNSIPLPSTNSSSSPSKLASSPNSLPTHPLPFLPPNISLPYLAAAVASLANQQMINNTNTNTVNANSNINKSSSTTAPNTKANSKNNVKNAKSKTKSTVSASTVNPSLFPKADGNAAANALLLNNSIFTNQFLQILQQQQNKHVLTNSFAASGNSSSTVPIASNISKSNPINISSSFPSASKVKSKVSSSSLLINKSKNSKSSTSPNMKSKIKLPIKKDPLAISKNHRRSSIPFSQSFDSKNQMVNSLFNIVNNNNNNNNTTTTTTTTNNNKIIKMENGSEIKNYHDINEENSSDSMESNSLSNTQSTSPLLHISIPFSNLNIRSNNGFSPTMESTMESNLSTLCTVASQEAKLYIPDKSDNKDKLFNNFQDSIKEEENGIKMDTKESNIFSKLDTTNRNAPTSLLTQNIQNSNKINRDENAMMNEQSITNVSPMLNNEHSMEEDNKMIKTEMSPLSQPISMPMSLPTITINSNGLENGNERKSLQCINNLSSSVSSPLTLMSSSPKSPSTFSSTSSSSSSSSPFNHSVPHTALQRRKSRSMGCSKDYVCEICKPNKHFVQLAHLRIHQRKHTGERPFVCSYCNKSFAQQGNLKTHQRKHTGERPFTCPICFKTFTQSGNLKAHELLHQGVRPFVCEWCDKTFTQSGNLKTHQMKMHPDLIQHGDDALLKSPISSTRSSTEENVDRMQIDRMNEDEDNNQMMIDDNNNNINYNNRSNSNQFFNNNNNIANNQYLEMDNEDYDEIQPMESGVIRSNSPNDNDYYGNNYYQNSENIREEEEDFEEDEKSKYSNCEYEGDNENFDSNQPENNIKERQLLKRLKALLKRN